MTAMIALENEYEYWALDRDGRFIMVRTCAIGWSIQCVAF